MVDYDSLSDGEKEILGRKMLKSLKEVRKEYMGYSCDGCYFYFDNDKKMLCDVCDRIMEEIMKDR